MVVYALLQRPQGHLVDLRKVEPRWQGKGAWGQRGLVHWDTTILSIEELAHIHIDGARSRGELGLSVAQSRSGHRDTRRGWMNGQSNQTVSTFGVVKGQ